VSAATALLLVACGGGGGDDGPPAGPYAVNTALGHLLVNGRSWDLHGTANGQAFALTLSFAPLPAGLFPVNGVFAGQSLETLTVVEAGQSTSEARTIFFGPTNLAFFGVQFEGGICSVATANTLLPTTASIGAAGPLFTETDLDGCASSSLATGTTTSDWSLLTDSGVPLLCWNLKSTDLSGTVVTESTCVEIAVDGSLGTRARYVATALGLTVSARNF
jgi:hypothetical protein